MDRLKGIAYAITSSATFGLAPLFTVLLIQADYSPFEVLSYRWGIAFLIMLAFGIIRHTNFKLSFQDFKVVFFLSLFRAATAFSLIIAYANIATGTASIIHFMYPLAVALTMMVLFKEPKSWITIISVVISIAGAILLSIDNLSSPNNGNAILGLVCACISIFCYGGYIIGVRKSRAVNIPSLTLTCYIIGLSTVYFIIGGLFTGGIRMETSPELWMYIVGLAVFATAISGITLIQSIKLAGPTLTSILGAFEPLTAVVIGIIVFNEIFTLQTAIGIVLITASVLMVVTKK